MLTGDKRCRIMMADAVFAFKVGSYSLHPERNYKKIGY